MSNDLKRDMFDGNDDRSEQFIRLSNDGHGIHDASGVATFQNKQDVSTTVETEVQQSSEAHEKCVHYQPKTINSSFDPRLLIPPVPQGPPPPPPPPSPKNHKGGPYRPSLPPPPPPVPPIPRPRPGASEAEPKKPIRPIPPPPPPPFCEHTAHNAHAQSWSVPASDVEDLCLCNDAIAHGGPRCGGSYSFVTVNGLPTLYVKCMVPGRNQSPFELPITTAANDKWRAHLKLCRSKFSTKRHCKKH